MSKVINSNNFDEQATGPIEASTGSQVVEPETRDAGDPAATLSTWLADVRARDVTFTLSNNRLRVEPWRLLTTEDQATLREHRAAIKNLVAAGLPELPAPPSSKPESREIDPAILRIINWHTPEEQQRRSAEATALAIRMLWRTSPYL
jgi:hypothetical protein